MNVYIKLIYGMVLVTILVKGIFANSNKFNFLKDEEGENHYKLTKKPINSEPELNFNDDKHYQSSVSLSTTSSSVSTASTLASTSTITSASTSVSTSTSTPASTLASTSAAENGTLPWHVSVSHTLPSLTTKPRPITKHIEYDTLASVLAPTTIEAKGLLKATTKLVQSNKTEKTSVEITTSLLASLTSSKTNSINIESSSHADVIPSQTDPKYESQNSTTATNITKTSAINEIKQSSYKDNFTKFIKKFIGGEHPKILFSIIIIVMIILLILIILCLNPKLTLWLKNLRRKKDNAIKLNQNDHFIKSRILPNKAFNHNDNILTNISDISSFETSYRPSCYGGTSLSLKNARKESFKNEFKNDDTETDTLFKENHTSFKKSLSLGQTKSEHEWLQSSSRL